MKTALADYCTTKEASEILKVTHGRVRQLVAGGRFKTVLHINDRVVMLLRKEVREFKRMVPGRKPA